MGTTIGVMKGDTRSLDYSSYGLIVPRMPLGVRHVSGALRWGQLGWMVRFWQICLRCNRPQQTLWQRF